MTINNGPYGWKINNSEEVAQIIEEIRDGKEVEREPVYYSQDGVHPTQPGNRVIALELLRRATIEE